MTCKGVVRFRPEHEAEFCFTQGRLSSGFLFLGGMAAIDAQGEVLHKGDLAAQMRAIYQDIAELLAGYGMSLEDIVRETIFTADIEAWRQTLPLRREIFGAATPPPGSIVGVSALADPDMLIEIEITARRRSFGRRIIKAFSDALVARTTYCPSVAISGRVLM